MKKIVLFSALFVLAFGLLVQAQTAITPAPSSTNIQARDYNYLLGTLNGISDNLLKQHFQLYQGYVKSLNEMNAKLSANKNLPGNASYSEYRGIVGSKPFSQNGIVLHELFFSNLSGKPTTRSAQLDKLIIRDFGSYENYISELKEAAKSARAGWVITGLNTRDNKLYNYVVDLHDEHVPLGVRPILVSDMWEHSYILDYGINKAEYIDTFIKNIDWDTVSKRLE